MPALNMNCYEGDRCFAFVSYKRDESDIIYPIIEHLMQEGYRIWIDTAENAIAGGEKWHDVLMNHIDACHVFICFLSDLSVNHSPYCCDERRRALEQGKDILPIYVDQLVLLPAEEEALGDFHSLFLTNYPNRLSDGLLRDIGSAKGMPECKIPADTRDGGSIYWQDGSWYEGGIEDGEPHGFGCKYWPDGSYLGGEFVRGAASRGTKHFRGGSVYEGEFDAEGKRSGQGTLRSAIGEVYEGEWLHDCRHGHGRSAEKSGWVYDGDWEDDARSGWGVLTSPAGYRYEGEWKKNKRNGLGTVVYPPSDQRESAKGNFYSDALQGFGVVCYRDGRIYEGNWSKDEQSGYGTMTWPDGWVYEGNWKSNEPHGRGKLTPPHDNPIDQVWSSTFKPHHRL
ncbi:MAG: TIR domain-containing protein [Eggerthellaceae bacterium]|nr:TIR domain-containing protein [Eggerthellaceae bacterium]